MPNLIDSKRTKLVDELCISIIEIVCTEKLVCGEAEGGPSKLKKKERDHEQEAKLRYSRASNPGANQLNNISV